MFFSNKSWSSIYKRYKNFGFYKVLILIIVTSASFFWCSFLVFLLFCFSPPLSLWGSWPTLSLCFVVKATIPTSTPWPLDGPSPFFTRHCLTFSMHLCKLYIFQCLCFVNAPLALLIVRVCSSEGLLHLLCLWCRRNLV